MNCPICDGCHDPRCEEGWIYVEEAKKGNAAQVKRCPAWTNRLKTQKYAAGLAAAGLDDEQYIKSWDELDLSDRNWKAAQGVASNIQTVVSSGLNVVLTGHTGTGKTLAGVLICRAAMDAGHTAVKLKWESFLDGIKDGFNDRSIESEGRKIERICSADILLLDDIGEGGSDNKFSLSRLEKIITRRYDDKKATILTANATPLDLRDLLGDRAGSRIHGRVLELSFTGKRFRGDVERSEVSDLVQEIWRHASN